MTTIAWVDSMLSLVGRTPCVRTVVGERELALKLEGFNPTGTIFDRVVAHGRITSPRPHLTDAGPLAASLAMLASTMRIPFTYSESRPTLFGSMAEAFGAEQVEAAPDSGFELNLDAVRTELYEEIVADLGVPVRMLMPALPNVAEAEHDLEMRQLLGSKGILIDARSAAVVRQALTLPCDDLIAVVCLADGALDQDGTL